MRGFPGRALLPAIFFTIVFLSQAISQPLQADLLYSPNSLIVEFKAQSIPNSITIDNGIIQTGMSDFDLLSNRFETVEMRPVFPKAIENGAPELAGFYRLSFATNIGLETIVDAYSGLAILESAEAVPIHKMNYTPNDPYRTSQWALNKIDAYQAWDVTHGSSSVALAILDSGVDWDHPDLNSDIWQNTADPVDGADNDGNGYVDDYHGWDFVTGISGCWSGEDCSTPDNNPMDYAGHGTHCAGIAAAETNNGTGVAGIGFNCEIMCLRIGWLSSNGWGYVDMGFAAEALYYAGLKGAKAANCSWGSSFTSSLAAAVSYANSHGVIIVTAAGNDGNSVAPYLGTRTDVIAVAATDQYDHKPSWSNYGTWVDIAAPGVNIISTYFNNNYTYLDGTSMAAPHVVGVIGLICAADPGMSRSRVFELVLSSAEPINDTYYNQGLLGSGRLNAFNAVEGLGGFDPPNLMTPDNGSFTADNTPMFQWTAIPGATYYHLQVDNSNQFTSPEVDNSSLTTTNYIVPTPLSDGTWYWRARAGDGTNWSNWSSVWSVGVDTTPPGSPIGLSVNPTGWSTSPDFTFNWTDPSDFSGIGYYVYKMDSPPVGDYDYDGLFGSRPADYTESTAGSHTLFLWLGDTVGNLDYTTATSVDFYFDNIPPSGCEASSTPVSPTETFTVSWSAGSDGESGLSGLYDIQYTDDGGPWTPWLSGSTDLSAQFPGLDGHTYQFEARTSDIAGNVEPFLDIAETTTEVSVGSSACGFYVAGDFNGDLNFNVSDIVNAFSRLKTGSPDPDLLCECPPGGGNFWPVAMDVNNTCAFDVSDIIAGFSRLKSGTPDLVSCQLCPPFEPPPVPPNNNGVLDKGE